jgi:uncharacterized membrane protein
MDVILVGVCLIVVGVAIFFYGRGRSKRTSVHATRGSVAVGGNNNGSITNTNTNRISNEAPSGGHALTVLSILVELVGIAVIVWHTMHLAGK